MFNAYLIEKQSYLTKNALRDNVKEGKAHGVLKYGFKTDENKYLKIDEEEAEIVRMIFDLSLQGIDEKTCQCDSRNCSFINVSTEFRI